MILYVEPKLKLDVNFLKGNNISVSDWNNIANTLAGKIEKTEYLSSKMMPYVAIVTSNGTIHLKIKKNELIVSNGQDTFSYKDISLKEGILKGASLLRKDPKSNSYPLGFFYQMDAQLKGVFWESQQRVLDKKPVSKGIMNSFENYLKTIKGFLNGGEIVFEQNVPIKHSVSFFPLKIYIGDKLFFMSDPLAIQFARIGAVSNYLHEILLKPSEIDQEKLNFIKELLADISKISTFLHCPCQVCNLSEELSKLSSETIPSVLEKLLHINLNLTPLDKSAQTQLYKMADQLKNLYTPC